LAALPSNILLPSGSTGLPKDSVANVTQVIEVDRSLLTERIGRISRLHLKLLWKGLDLLFDR
jgi:mRNA interferase MazF